MKTKLLPYLGLAVALQLVGAGPARGDEAPATNSGAAAATKLETWKGTIAAVDPQQRTVSVKSFWRTRTFNAADPCSVALENKPEASLADLHPGQELEVRYENRHGVRVADHLIQHDQVYTGYLSALDPGRRTFRVRHGLLGRTFTLADQGAVTLANDKSATLKELKLGQTVRVVYESGKGEPTAVQVDQKYPTFAGTIRAIDSDARIVRAKSLLDERTFHLADGCRIVVNGKLNASLNDLRIGEHVSFTYEDAHGVLIASRIGREATAPETTTAQMSRATIPPAN